MSIRNRVAKLERTLAGAARTECEGCRGPVPGQNMVEVVDESGRLAWGRCGVCGLALDRNGEPLAAVRVGPRGRVKPTEYAQTLWEAV